MAPQLVTELQTQLAGHLSEWQDLFNLFKDAGIPFGDYQIDEEQNVKSAVPALVGELMQTKGSVRALARSLLKSKRDVRFSWSVLIEIHVGINAPVVWAFSRVSGFAAAMALIVFAVLQLSPTHWPKGYVHADFTPVGDELIVEFVADEAFANRPADELVFVPVVGRRIELFDICHLAVLSVGVRSSAPVKPGERVRAKVIDMKPGSSDCHLESVSDILKLVWGVTADVEHYPGIFLLRAKLANDRAGKVELDQTRDPADKRRERERLYNEALQAKRSALQIYRTDRRFSDTSEARVAGERGNLETLVEEQRLMVNSVASEPRHEMVLVPSCLSHSWSETGGRQLNLADYWIDRFEISKHQYSVIMNWPEWHADPEPARSIKWEDAKMYCLRLGLRLPTDAEYEKVATWDPRNSRARPWPWGHEAPLLDRDWGRLHPVQKVVARDSSPYEVINLIGSVAEWTERLLPGSSSDPAVQERDIVIKGGSFLSQRVSEVEPTKFRRGSESGIGDVGFRCASSARPKNPEVLVRVHNR